jgi:hypothetical protein
MSSYKTDMNETLFNVNRIEPNIHTCLIKMREAIDVLIAILFGHGSFDVTFFQVSFIFKFDVKTPFSKLFDKCNI